MDLFTKFNQAGITGIPLIAFLTGLAGSLHCVVMCGAFATSCSQLGSKKSGVAYYNIGRILSYSLLGAFAGLLGSGFTTLFKNPWVEIIPAVLLGFFFLAWGLSLFKGKSFHPSLPGLLHKKLNLTLGRVYQMQAGSLRSLFLGIFTVFLPCGLLYGIILALAAFQDPFTGALGMLFFGLGTLPALALGTNIISKVFNPLKESWPNLTSLCLISFGLFTIVYRIFTAYEKINCH